MKREDALKTLAEVGDKLADDHVEHCPFGAIGRQLRDAARGELAAGSGPAQVATEAYRNNWEGIFGKRTEVALGRRPQHRGDERDG